MHPPPTYSCAYDGGDAGRRDQRRVRRTWVPLAAGLVTFLVGARDIAIVVRPQLWERVQIIDHVLPGGSPPDTVHGVAAAALVVSGALLILLSHALRRRKRRAWRAVVAVLAISVALHLVHRPTSWSLPGSTWCCSAR